ncbi:MAG: sugar nucleotide-binding protein [Planctomycetaceae bacterium]
MERVFIVGIDSVVGANTAVHAAERHAVAGVWFDHEVEVEGCQCEPAEHGAGIGEQLRAFQPDCLIYCGPESYSSWDATSGPRIVRAGSDLAATWAAAARGVGAKFVMISSDAVFTAPWMFHEEDSEAFCESAAARTILKSERNVQTANPEALIVRTNAFGWSPTGEGLIESLIQQIEGHRTIDQDHIRHATPILASDLADIIERAVSEDLTGIYHVAGAERVNPMSFAQRLADQFDLPWLALRRETSLSERPAGFGAAESSLQTKKIRKALCVAMPMIAEGLDRLSRQQVDGHRDYLNPVSHAELSRAA